VHQVHFVSRSLDYVGSWKGSKFFFFISDTIVYVFNIYIKILILLVHYNL
jgi:hypothetical protein